MASLAQVRESEPVGRPADRAVPLIGLAGIEKRFGTGTLALARIDLDIAQGDFVTLIGPSGCGKSTLLKVIANLVAPSAGAVAWRGVSLDRRGVAAGNKLAFVFQDPTLMPWCSVLKNVRLPLDLAGEGTATSNARAQAALARVGLQGFEAHYPRQLSGGMRMRVSIARALVTEPDVILMDEPFGALDEISRNKLDADLLALHWERKLTTIFVTHSIYEAVFLSTRIVVMSAHPGRIHREMRVSAPQPRDAAFRDSEAFSSMCRTLSAWLGEASQATPGGRAGP